MMIHAMIVIGALSIGHLSPAWGVCPTNISGGPGQLTLVTKAEGSDLDLGWKGAMHSVPMPPGTSVTLCLSGCDGAGNAPCAADGRVGPGTENGETFGPPVPVMASDTPLCIVNAFRDDITGGSTDPTTGETSALVKLTSLVYITDKTAVCPRCRGGICDSGARQGGACTVDGELRVVQAVGDTLYPLSRDCLPQGSSTQVSLDLPLTTGTTTGLASGQCGPPNFPLGRCNVQVRDDQCSGTSCGAQCTGLACIRKIPDPSDPTKEICVDGKGGLSQQCCIGDTQKPCQRYPVTRTGRAVAPAPSSADPAILDANETLVAALCFSATGLCNVDVIAGLPGPATMTLPVLAAWSPGSGVAPSSTTVTSVPMTSTTSSTVTPPAGTNPTPAPTTTVPCRTARCTVDGTLTGVCQAVTLPANVRGAIDKALGLVEQATSATGKKATKVAKKARKALRSAGKVAAKAGKGRKPKIPSECAAAIQSTTGSLAAGLAS